jgi:hypothetical protein
MDCRITPLRGGPAMTRAKKNKSRAPVKRRRDPKRQLCQFIRGQSDDSLLRDRSDGAQIFSGRLAAPAVRDDVVRHLLALVEGVHAGAFDRADMNEDVLAAVLRLNEAKTLLAVKPLHSTRIHAIFLSLTVYAWELARNDVRPCPGSSILEKFLKRARRQQ